MVELLQGHILTLLHLAFGLPEERPFLRGEHIIGIDQFLWLYDHRTPMLLNCYEVPFAHVEVVKDFAWDNGLPALADASDPLLGGSRFTCHAFRLSDSQPDT